jgi:hypothetical protein
LKSSKDAYSIFVPGSGEGGKASVQSCPVTAFGLPIPAYAIRTTLETLQPGDVVIIPSGGTSEQWLYFLNFDKEGEHVRNAVINGIRVDDGVITQAMITESMFLPGDSVLCVKNVIGKQTELTKMLPLLAIMGAGGKGADSADKFSKLILCMLMGQGSDMSGKGMDMKALLPMMLLGGGSGDNGLMAALMLQNGIFK